MKKIIVAIILFGFTSCNENYLQDYYPNGNIKIKIQANENNVADGEYIEYYETGEIKVKTVYSNGILKDTVYSFHKNGMLKGKGIMNKNQKDGWWKLYNPSGILINETEYYSGADKTYRNQWINFKENGDTIFSSSNFYKLYIADTLRLGKNVGKVRYYSSANSENKFYEITIDNQISETRIDRDTFPQEQDITRFGIYAYKTGTKNIKGDIIETVFDIKEISADSVKATELRRVTSFRKEVFIKE